MSQLLQFIEDDIARRKMSIRQYAEFTSIGAGNISNVLNSKQGAGLNFLTKLSRATGVTVESLEALRDAAPDDDIVIRYITDEPETTEIPPHIQWMIDLYDSLTPGQQNLIDTMIEAFRAQNELAAQEEEDAP